MLKDKSSAAGKLQTPQLTSKLLKTRQNQKVHNHHYHKGHCENHDTHFQMLIYDPIWEVAQQRQGVEEKEDLFF